jgi:hypothetical protein
MKTGSALNMSDSSTQTDTYFSIARSSIEELGKNSKPLHSIFDENTQPGVSLLTTNQNARVEKTDIE